MSENHFQLLKGHLIASQNEGHTLLIFKKRKKADSRLRNMGEENNLGFRDINL